MARKSEYIIGWLGVSAALLAASAVAQPRLDAREPVYLEAEKLGYDQKNAIVIARGKVEVVQGSTVLFADQLTYYQNEGIVRADGNVVVTDEDGNAYFGDQVQLREDLREGVIRQFRIRMVDNSQFAAVEARRVSETQTELTKAVYSACKICEGKSPFWQMKAGEVEIDEDKQRVYYEDLTLEMMGVPVAYTPYFFHPTPDAGRKSGILKPEYQQTSNLGTVIKVPVYVNIAPDKDATVTPIFTSEEGMVMETEYRQLTDNGQFHFNGSLTYTDKRDDTGVALDENEFRGHIFARGVQGLTEHWSTGFDVQRSTDDTYMRKYRYGDYKSLNSRVYAERVEGRSHALIQTMAFQGLQLDDDPDREPFVLPLAQGYYESDAGWNGSRWFTAGNTQVIERDEGPKSRRLSVTGGYKLPVVTGGGHLFDMQASVRNDVYSVEDVTLASGENYDGEKVRVIPEAAVKWRYPLMKQVGSGSMTIEPTVLAVAAGRGNNPQEIPNEDNRIPEFSDNNLFHIHRFPGSDTVDEGSRIAYGVRGQWMMNQRANAQFLLGQNYSFENDTPYPYRQQAGESRSDYVARVGLDYRPFEVEYQVRLDPDDLTARGNMLLAGYSSSPLDLNLGYVTLDNDAFLSDREELLASMGLAVTDEWTITGSGRRDLLNDDMLFASAGLVFQNDCFTLYTNFSKQYTRDRDYEPDTSFTVRVAFKNLNEL